MYGDCQYLFLDKRYSNYFCCLTKIAVLSDNQMLVNLNSVLLAVSNK
jgi:hypothetical protein